jgi:iron complex transport system ATP-binding protein
MMPTSRPPRIIEVCNLSFSYDSSPVLKNLNFNISKGEFTGIIAPNGAGKSTLLKILASLLRQNSGSVKIKNLDIDRYSRTEIAQLTAYVPQTPHINANFTVQEIVKMGRFPYKGLPKEQEDSIVVHKLLEKMDLKRLKDRSIATLSGGEKQRVLITAALAQEPDIILLDEPTSALDIKHQQSILYFLSQLTQSTQTTVITVMHDINLSAQFCTNLILLSDAKLIKDGPPENVLKFPIIEKVYGVKVYIDIHPFTKSLYMLPYAVVEPNR